MDHGPYKGTEPMIHFELNSNDGCKHTVSSHSLYDLAYNGGVTWSKASRYYQADTATLPIGQIPFNTTLSPTSPALRHNVSTECKDRDLLIASTAWTKPISAKERMSGGYFRFNATYERSAGFRIRGMLCESRFSKVEHDFTAT